MSPSGNKGRRIMNLSIIVPVYNIEEYLDECLQSVIKQNTKYSYQIIIIDDGSTDGSSGIIKRYCNCRNVIVVEKQNEGLSSARNIGIKKAEGEYICFVDGDDYVSENYVETMLNAAYGASADFVKCGHIRFGEGGTKNYSYGDSIITDINSDRSSLKIDGCAWGCIIKKNIFGDVEFPKGYWYEDIIMRCLIVSKCKKISTISDRLYNYRINKLGLSRCKQKAKTEKCLEQVELMERMIDIQKKKEYQISNYLLAVNVDELTSVLWARTRHLDKKTKIIGFRKLRVLAGTINQISGWTPFFEKNAYYSARIGSYTLWSFFSFMATVTKRIRYA